MHEVFRNYETRAWDVEFIDTFYSKVRIPFGGKALSVLADITLILSCEF